MVEWAALGCTKYTSSLPEASLLATTCRAKIGSSKKLKAFCPPPPSNCAASSYCARLRCSAAVQDAADQDAADGAMAGCSATPAGLGMARLGVTRSAIAPN